LGVREGRLWTWDPAQDPESAGLMCVPATFLRDGRVCEDCAGGCPGPGWSTAATAGPGPRAAMVSKLRGLFPGLVVAYAWSPPFRPLSPEEDAQVVREIGGSGARVLFVGLGCPKQERWMGEHRGRVSAVMLGVGAAFDFHGGRVRQAPPGGCRSGAWSGCSGWPWSRGACGGGT